MKIENKRGEKHLHTSSVVREKFSNPIHGAERSWDNVDETEEESTDSTDDDSDPGGWMSIENKHSRAPVTTDTVATADSTIHEEELVQKHKSKVRARTVGEKVKSKADAEVAMSSTDIVSSTVTTRNPGISDAGAGGVKSKAGAQVAMSPTHAESPTIAARSPGISDAKAEDNPTHEESNPSDENDDIEINLTEADIEGQFAQLGEEYDISDMEIDIIEGVIQSFVKEKSEELELDWDEEMREAMANIIVSTLRQEFEQIG